MNRFYHSINVECILYFLVFITVTAPAQTLVYNDINFNTTWTKIGSPYIVTSDVVLTQGIKLTLEPGVTVRFREGKRFHIQGQLIAKGNINDSIHFIPDSAGKVWNGFVAGAYTLALNPKIEMSYASGNSCQSLFKILTTVATGTLLEVTHSTFTQCRDIIVQPDVPKSYAVYIDSCDFTWIYNIDMGASNDIIKNSKFKDGTMGFSNTVAQKTIIDNCEFDHFTIAVNVTGLVTNCKFHDNTIAVELNSLNSSTISFNDIQNNTAGIQSYSTALTLITKNMIKNNTGGIDLSAASSATISYNEIRDNTSGINSRSTSSLTFITHNIICHNGLYSNSPVDLMAPHNCWCLTDSAMIARRGAVAANESGGRVLFMPFDTDCPDAGPVAVNRQTVSEQNVMIYPNPSHNTVTVLVDEAIIQDIVLLDATGKTIGTFRSFVRQNSASYQMNIAHLDPGIYFIRIRSGDQFISKKLLKL